MSDVSQCVVPPRVGVTPSRRIPSDVSQQQRKTTDDWDPGPRVQRAIPVPGESWRGALPKWTPRTPWRGVQTSRRPWRGVQQQRAPTKGVQQRAPTKGIQPSRTPWRGVQPPRTPWRGVQLPRTPWRGVQPPRTPWRGVQPPGTLLRGVPSDPAVVERRYHTRMRVVP